MSGGSDRKPPDDPPNRPAPVADRQPEHEPLLSAERHRKADGRLLILYRWGGEDG